MTESTLPPSPCRRPELAARGALATLFVVDGVVFASWTSRLPQVQESVGAGNGGLGVALIGTAIGAFTAMPLIGWWCRRHAPAPVALLAGFALCGAAMLPGLAGSPLVLLALLLAFGAAYGAVDVSMNASAVQLAEHRRRPILPALHAGFSAGNVAGAGAGALLSALGVSVEAHLLGVGLLGALVLACCAPGLWRPGSPEPHAAGHRHLGRVLWLVLAAAALTFAAAFGEGTIANWSGIHLREQAGAAAGVLPLGYAVFALAQVIGRSAGTPLAARFGTRPLVVTGILLGVAGQLVVLVPNTAVLLAGYFVTGIGLSSLFPLGIARAGALGGSAGVAVASTLGYGGVLLGPPIVGLLAGQSSLAIALLLPAVLLAACLGMTATLREE
ncbi:MFS transporter [Sciscionella marina]|uniref:MFS transporter n=1 Tax=Sciscionella marina TaxID=508770 RepID=UPI000362EA56|nr:MFS transporter [Sciscionella marina]